MDRTLLGQALSEVVASEFTRFFQFSEQQRGPSGGGTLVLFQSAAQGFGAQVGWYLDGAGRVRGAMLVIRRAYLEDQQNGAFARDLVGSFLRAACAAEDLPEVGKVADEITYGRRRYQVVRAKGSLDGKAFSEQQFLVPEGEDPKAGGALLRYPGYLPVPPPTPSQVYLAFQGQGATARAVLRHTVLELANQEQPLPSGAERMLLVTVRERPGKE